MSADSVVHVWSVRPRQFLCSSCYLFCSGLDLIHCALLILSRSVRPGGLDLVLLLLDLVYCAFDLMSGYVNALYYFIVWSMSDLS
jgi:hypothetical protein